MLSLKMGALRFWLVRFCKGNASCWGHKTKIPSQDFNSYSEERNVLWFSYISKFDDFLKKVQKENIDISSLYGMHTMSFYMRMVVNEKYKVCGREATFWIDSRGSIFEWNVMSHSFIVCFFLFCIYCVKIGKKNCKHSAYVVF